MIRKGKIKGIRLNRYLALCGVASRRKCESYISEGRVSINGQVVQEFATQVHEDDEVRCDDRPVRPQSHAYIVMNKPAGIITTLQDEHGRQHVGELLPQDPPLKPVGRLDRDTTGVLLMTNDGQLLYRLTHPKFEISRLYRVTLDRSVPEQTRQQISRGIRLEDGKMATGRVIDHREKGSQGIVTLELKEGLKREIKRMFKILGYRVVQLQRMEYAGISAAGLAQGEWRYLKPRELRRLKMLCGLPT